VTARAAILLLLLAGALPAAEPPRPAPPESPVAQFRRLLAAPAAERAALLDARPPRQREGLERRLAAYDAMPPAVREQRLAATELYWHLAPLLRAPAAERAALLGRAPEAWHAALAGRLAAWDALAPADRAALLQHGEALHHFARVRAETLPPRPGAQFVPAPSVPHRVETQLAHFRGLPEAQRRRIQGQWRGLFEPGDEAAPAAALAGEERAAMEAALARFRTLDAAQRRACVEAFGRFAEMTAEERNRFLRSAERWAQLAPADRAAWRTLVTKLPPLPPGFFDPPLPPRPELRPQLSDAGR
jgi:hypothetical protein